MRKYLIAYDYTRPKDKQEYLDVIHEIGSQGIKIYDLFDPTASTWLIESELTARELGKILINYFDRKDKLLVAEITPNVAWYGLNKDQVKYFLGPASLTLNICRDNDGETSK